MNYYFIEQEARNRIAELRQLAQQDALALLAQRVRGEQRRSAVVGWLSNLLRFEGVRHVTAPADCVAYPRRDIR